MPKWVKADTCVFEATSINYFRSDKCTGEIDNFILAAWTDDEKRVDLYNGTYEECRGLLNRVSEIIGDPEVHIIDIEQLIRYELGKGCSTERSSTLGLNNQNS